MKALRSRLRRRRRELPPAAARGAAAKAARHLWRLPVLQRARRIAFYLAFDGEIGCAEAMDEGWARGRRLFLPVLGTRALRFAPFTPGGPLAANRFGIPEPVVGRRALVDPRHLDVVVAPLVAFDASGTRLGMGGGFYDRTLAFLLHRRRFARPCFIGLAYRFQQVEQLERREWDVPVDFIVTDAGVVVAAER